MVNNSSIYFDEIVPLLNFSNISINEIHAIEGLLMLSNNSSTYRDYFLNSG